MCQDKGWACQSWQSTIWNGSEILFACVGLKGGDGINYVIPDVFVALIVFSRQGSRGKSNDAAT